MQLKTTLEELRRYLPIQLPLGSFIHNNMLVSFEDRPFAQGVAEAAKIFGAVRALPESYYREKYRRNRIAHDKVEQSIKSWLREHGVPETLSCLSLVNLAWELLQSPIEIPERVHPSGVADYMDEAGLLRAPHLPQEHATGKEWKRVFKEKLGEDVNASFHPLFIRFLSAYLDQGMATWHNPDTHLGLLESFRAFVAVHQRFAPAWMEKVRTELAQVSGDTALDWLERHLTRLPFVSEPRSYLLETLIELRGWAGMVNKFETEPHFIPRHAPLVRLSEYLVIYLILEKAHYEESIQHHKLEDLRILYEPYPLERLNQGQVAHLLKALASRGLLPETRTSALTQRLLELSVKFHAAERALVWQEALDLSVREQCLSAVNEALKSPQKTRAKPAANFYFCIDDREESIRRLLEEDHPEYDTLGVVGFFGIDMKFKSVLHPEPVIHCPPVVNPSRVVEEKWVQDGIEEKTFIPRGAGDWHFWYGTRSSVRSVFFSLVTGPLTMLVLLLRVFFPRLAAKFSHQLKNWVNPNAQTRIHFSASDGPGGYELSEMANIVATILKFAGTKSDLPEVNFMVAHGATSTNNPYQNAYGCGACSGKAGIPNAQIFCGMANSAKVREELRLSHGIDIAENVVFVACYHDTSTDEIVCFNQADIPAEKKAAVERGLSHLRTAAQKNSLERCRHFASARHLNDQAETLAHVSGRAASLAEPRPEYGHNNTAMVVVGRRSITRGLFLDRRCFLVSYDASTDPSGATLSGVLAGAVPVAGGISLDYYFSRIDNEIYGSGTKLPLNIAGLVGVMTGSSSDLRVGLARQMVELHEPVRITIVIEAEETTVWRIIQNHPRMKRMVENHWLHLAVLNPATGELKLFEEGMFRTHSESTQPLVMMESSESYAPHRKGPLPFARLNPQQQRGQFAG
jgi:hypothetical protein